MKLLTQLASKEYCPGYKKGDKFTTWKIAENYKTAIENGNWSLGIFKGRKKSGRAFVYR